MNQLASTFGKDNSVIVTLTWWDDKKVYIKYYFHNNEVKQYDKIPLEIRQKIESDMERFFEFHPELIKYSY